LSGGYYTTLAKSFIISLENIAASWYARLPPRSFTKWTQLKENVLVNYQGFQEDLSIEEDFFSCQQYERETLPDFLRRFLHLKAQTLEVSYEQAIMQAIKELCIGQLHSHLVRECLRTQEELYDNFQNFSRVEVLHFRNLGQQRKLTNESECSWPNKYIKNRESTTSFDPSHKQVHDIDLDGCGPTENWEKNLRTGAMILGETIITLGVAT
jgi:hypothetical protein